MRERALLILKIACGVLAALLLFQVARLVLRANPLRGVGIPELPTLPASLEATNAMKGSNIVPGKVAGTNATNVVSHQQAAEKGTNVATAPAAGTNATNSGTSQKLEERRTNAPPAEASGKAGTNAPAHSVQPPETNVARADAPMMTETNSPLTQASGKTQTNTSSGLTTQKTGTNAATTNSLTARATGGSRPPPSMSPPGMVKMPELPPLILARIDKIAQSEILAPFMRRMPMALLGIAGNDAFLRAPSGQTGLAKEGDEMGGIKLLKIGINRVLVEQEGEKKELTIFSGIGGESLLPKPKPATNETNIEPK